MAKNKRLAIPKPVNGYGYVGVWNGPKTTLGWMVSPFVSGKNDRRYPSSMPQHMIPFDNTRLFLCEISIRPLLNKNGSPITKIIKRKKE